MGKIKQEMGMRTPKTPAGIQRTASQSSFTVSGSTALTELVASPSFSLLPPPPPTRYLTSRLGWNLQRCWTGHDLPSIQWAAVGEARTSTQPASSLLSNFLGGALAESLFLQKHRSTWHPLYRSGSALSSLDINEIRHPMTTRTRLMIKRGKGVFVWSDGVKKLGGDTKIWKASQSCSRNKRVRSAGGRAGLSSGWGDSQLPARLRCQCPNGWGRRLVTQRTAHRLVRNPTVSSCQTCPSVWQAGGWD